MDRKQGVSEKKKTGRDNRIGSILAVLFWLLVWQVLSMQVRNNILVASPAKTCSALAALLKTAEFWKSVGFSFSRIACGFLFGVIFGVLLAVLSAAVRVINYLVTPLLRLIKAVPVASFIILALLWVSSRQLSVLISFLMVLPVVYTNVLQGIRSTDPELLQMADVFFVRAWKRFRYIYLPAVLPHFVSACSVGLGFCFKSGIAAEIIGLPDNSIGEKLYEAKLYLMTGELFAWTAVIVLISFCFEHMFMFVIRRLAAGLCGRFARLSVREPVPSTEKGMSTEYTRSANDTAEYGLFSVTKSFSDKTVLSEFTLFLPKGRTVALMGPSGSGKSTAGKLLLGLLTPDAGEVRTGSACSAVFQEDRLCPEFDALTNVMLVNNDRAAARQALLEVGLGNLFGKPVSEYSGGMKRRVAIVRAVLADAGLVVLDEPFTGLDEEGRKKMVAWVQKRLKGRTVLLITHRADEAKELAEQVILLE